MSIVYCDYYNRQRFILVIIVISILYWIQHIKGGEKMLAAHGTLIFHT